MGEKTVRAGEIFIGAMYRSTDYIVYDWFFSWEGRYRNTDDTDDTDYADFLPGRRNRFTDDADDTDL